MRIGRLEIPMGKAVCWWLVLAAQFGMAAKAQVIWQENFSYPNGTTTGANNNTANPAVDWTSQCPSCSSGDWFEVRSNQMEALDVNGPATLETEWIDIAGFAQGVEVLVDLEEDGDMEGCPGGVSSGCNSVDWIRIEYSLDGAPYADWTSPNGGACSGACAGATYVAIGNFAPFTFRECPLVGDSLRLRISVQCWATTEFLWIDNIIVQGQTCVSFPITDSLVHVQCHGGTDGEIWVFSQNPNQPLSYSLNGGSFQSANHFPGLSAGTYFVVVRDNFGNLDTLSGLEITEPPGLGLHLGNDTLVCEADSLILDAGAPGLAYLWSTGDTTQQITVSASGIYSLIATDQIGCQAEDTLAVTFTSPPVIDLGPDTNLCDQAIFGLDADPLGLYLGATFAWSNGETTPAILVSESGDYEVVVEYGQGCIGRDSIDIRLQFTPQVELGPDTFVCSNSAFALNADPQDQYPEAGFTWNTGEEGSELLIPTTGTYRVTVENECGTAQDSIYIEINQGAPRIFIPNAFTPNRDGLNETFLPVSIHMEDYTLTIFDRWGKVLFESRDPSTGWDGTFRGKPLPEGIFVYQLKVRNCFGDMEIRRGSLLLYY